MGTKYILNSASEKKSNIYFVTCHEIHDRNVVESVRAGYASSGMGSNPAPSRINYLRLTPYFNFEMRQYISFKDLTETFTHEISIYSAPLFKANIPYSGSIVK